jgi:hypothetical protein
VRVEVTDQQLFHAIILCTAPNEFILAGTRFSGERVQIKGKKNSKTKKFAPVDDTVIDKQRIIIKSVFA